MKYLEKFGKIYFLASFLVFDTGCCWINLNYDSGRLDFCFDFGFGFDFGFVVLLLLLLIL